MPTVPVIDVSALVPGRGPDPGGPTPAELACGSALDDACRDLGFFVVTGHGIDPHLLDALDAAAREFFARDEAEKARIAMANGGRAWRGWFPEGGELTSGRPDHKEGIYFGQELAPADPRVHAGLPLHGPNQFPAEPAALRPAVLAWLREMTALGHALARGLALGLGLAPTWFDDHLTADPTILFRIFRYPPRSADDDGWGVAEHTDYGLLTILAHDGTPGLQVRSGGEWIDVPAIDGTFVVNLGDMLERMTGGRYRSTPHRVRNVSTGPADRLSFPFFFDPGWDAEILPVPEAAFAADDSPSGSGSGDEADDRWDGASVHEWSGTYGEYLTAKVAKVFPTLGDAVLD